MVQQALTDLDPSSALGADGFTGGFYKRFRSEFAPVMLSIIQEVHESGVVPDNWFTGVTEFEGC